MITMSYPLVDTTQKSVTVLGLFYVYKNEKGDCVLFKIKSKSGIHHVLFSNIPYLLKESQYIQINKTVFNIKEIMENPDRIYSLMQQELLRDSIDNLP